MKKSFNQASKVVDTNPATNFLSKETIEAKDVGTQVNKVKDIVTKKKETKSKRTCLIFKPSTIKHLEKISTVQRTSLNALINNICEEYINQHQDDIKRYDEFFKV